MKIALLAPIEERVPPKAYGGTEAIVYTLAEELHGLGHDVTLLASGDSNVSCRLLPIARKSIGSSSSKRLREAYTYKALIKAARYLAKEKFDVLHNHIGWQALIFKDLFRVPAITTLHSPLEGTERIMYKAYKSSLYVSISDSQRRSLPKLNYLSTVYHGLQMERFPFSKKAGDYLVFLGRFSPFKGPVEAIRIAKRTGHKLIMAAKINEFEREFYEAKIKPLIDGNQIIYLGEIGHTEKVQLLGGAKALLSPIKWQEPFGLTNIEAMACGTPVIGSPLGALPEVISDGKTGFLRSGVDEMIRCVKKIGTIDRAACRAHVEEHFSAGTMALRYERLYRQTARQSSPRKVTAASRKVSIAT